MTKGQRKKALWEEKQLRKQGVKIDKPLEVCANCARWHRHYAEVDPASVPYCMPPFAPTPCGHCTYPRLKHREESDTCEHFLTLKDMSEEELMEAMTGDREPV